MFVAAVIGLLALLTPEASAAEATQSFDIPAGEARESLRIFSDQAKTQFFFSRDTVQGVRTNVVRGEFTPRQALDRMLAGTPLVVVKDEQTGAYTVRRDTSADSEKNADSRPAGSRTAPSSTPAGSADSDGPVPVRRSSRGAVDQPDGEPVMLSPFEVNADEDRGFAATTSLAGGRLRTDLRDTPASFSVMTSEFIEALNITNLDEAQGWITGNAPLLSSGSGNFFGNVGQYNTRGYAATGGTNGGAKPQRNFFTAFISSDSYSVERYEFGRGPNSILFGNGTLGGIPTATTKRARTDRAFQTVQTSVGSWQNYRATLDINQPLLDGKAAIRTALLWNDAEGWRDGDFNERRGAFLTTTFKPFPKTEIRVEGEYYHNALMQGLTGVGITERLSGWDGVTTFDGRVTTLPANNLNFRQGWNRRPGSYQIYNPSGFDGIMQYQNDPYTLSGGSGNLIPIGDFTYEKSGTPAFNSGNAPFIHQQNMRIDRFHRAINAVGYETLAPLFTEEFTPSHDGPIVTQRFKDIQFTISQQVGDNLFFELAGDSNSTVNHGNGLEQVGLAAIHLDINRALPDGSTNPNFLKPYADAELIRNDFRFEYEGLRAAAAYVMPETRFGKFTFNLMGGTAEQVRIQDYKFLTLREGADHRQWGSPALQAVRVRYYFDGSPRPLPDIAGKPVTYVNPTTGVTSTITPDYTPDNVRADTQQIDTTKLNYALAALNAKFFKDRLVVLGAVRWDDFTATKIQTMDRGDYPLDWDGKTTLWRPNAPADYHELTYQPLNSNGTPSGPVRQADTRPRISATGDRDPRYINDRFQNDYNEPVIKGDQVTLSVGSIAHIKPWLNPFFNYSETYNPPEGILRITGQQRPPTIAKGKDYGLRFELFDNRLSIGLTRYEAEEANAVEFSQPPNFNVIYDANAVGDQSVTGRNIRGVEPLPQVWRDLRIRKNEGDEIETVFNATRGLRLIANYSKPRIGEADRYPDTLPYIEANLPVLTQIVQDAGGIIGADGRASVDNSVPSDLRSPDVQGAVNTYNSIVTFQERWTGAAASIGDAQQTANFFADYTIQTGTLKNLRFGLGVNWRGKAGLGNRGNDSIANPNYDPALPINAANPIILDDPSVSNEDILYRPSYYDLIGTLGYSWKMGGREFIANLVVKNLTNERGPLPLNSASRPRGQDYGSPGRALSPGTNFALRQPINFTFSLTVKL